MRDSILIGIFIAILGVGASVGVADKYASAPRFVQSQTASAGGALYDDSPISVSPILADNPSQGPYDAPSKEPAAANETAGASNGAGTTAATGGITNQKIKQDCSNTSTPAAQQKCNQTRAKAAEKTGVVSWTDENGAKQSCVRSACSLTQLSQAMSSPNATFKPAESVTAIPLATSALPPDPSSAENNFSAAVENYYELHPKEIPDYANVINGYADSNLFSPTPLANDTSVTLSTGETTNNLFSPQYLNLQNNTGLLTTPPTSIGSTQVPTESLSAQGGYAPGLPTNTFAQPTQSDAQLSQNASQLQPSTLSQIVSSVKSAAISAANFVSTTVADMFSSPAPEGAIQIADNDPGAVYCHTVDCQMAAFGEQLPSPKTGEELTAEIQKDNATNPPTPLDASSIERTREGCQAAGGSFCDFLPSAANDVQAKPLPEPRDEPTPPAQLPTGCTSAAGADCSGWTSTQVGQEQAKLAQQKADLQAKADALLAAGTKGPDGKVTLTKENYDALQKLTTDIGKVDDQLKTNAAQSKTLTQMEQDRIVNAPVGGALPYAGSDKAPTPGAESASPRVDPNDPIAVQAQQQKVDELISNNPNFKGLEQFRRQEGDTVSILSEKVNALQPRLESAQILASEYNKTFAKEDGGKLIFPNQAYADVANTNADLSKTLGGAIQENNVQLVQEIDRMTQLSRDAARETDNSTAATPPDTTRRITDAEIAALPHSEKTDKAIDMYRSLQQELSLRKQEVSNPDISTLGPKGLEAYANSVKTLADQVTVKNPNADVIAAVKGLQSDYYQAVQQAQIGKLELADRAINSALVSQTPQGKADELRDTLIQQNFVNHVAMTEAEMVNSDLSRDFEPYYNDPLTGAITGDRNGVGPQMKENFKTISDNLQAIRTNDAIIDCLNTCKTPAGDPFGPQLAKTLTNPALTAADRNLIYGQFAQVAANQIAMSKTVDTIIGVENGSIKPPDIGNDGPFGPNPAIDPQEYADGLRAQLQSQEAKDTKIAQSVCELAGACDKSNETIRAIEKANGVNLSWADRTSNTFHTYAEHTPGPISFAAGFVATVVDDASRVASIAYGSDVLTPAELTKNLSLTSGERIDAAIVASGNTFFNAQIVGGAFKSLAIKGMDSLFSATYSLGADAAATFKNTVNGSFLREGGIALDYAVPAADRTAINAVVDATQAFREGGAVNYAVPAADRVAANAVVDAIQPFRIVDSATGEVVAGTAAEATRVPNAAEIVQNASKADAVAAVDNTLGTLKASGPEGAALAGKIETAAADGSKIAFTEAEKAAFSGALPYNKYGFTPEGFTEAVAGRTVAPASLTERFAADAALDARGIKAAQPGEGGAAPSDAAKAESVQQISDAAKKLRIDVLADPAANAMAAVRLSDKIFSEFTANNFSFRPSQSFARATLGEGSNIVVQPAGGKSITAVAQASIDRLSGAPPMTISVVTRDGVEQYLSAGVGKYTMEDYIRANGLEPIKITSADAAAAKAIKEMPENGLLIIDRHSLSALKLQAITEGDDALRSALARNMIIDESDELVSSRTATVLAENANPLEKGVTSDASIQRVKDYQAARESIEKIQVEKISTWDDEVAKAERSTAPKMIVAENGDRVSFNAAAYRELEKAGFSTAQGSEDLKMIGQAERRWAQAEGAPGAYILENAEAGSGLEKRIIPVDEGGKAQPMQVSQDTYGQIAIALAHQLDPYKVVRISNATVEESLTQLAADSIRADYRVNGMTGTSEGARALNDAHIGNSTINISGSRLSLDSVVKLESRADAYAAIAKTLADGRTALVLEKDPALIQDLVKRAEAGEFGKYNRLITVDAGGVRINGEITHTPLPEIIKSIDKDLVIGNERIARGLDFQGNANAIPMYVPPQDTLTQFYGRTGRANSAYDPATSVGGPNWATTRYALADEAKIADTVSVAGKDVAEYTRALNKLDPTGESADLLNRALGKGEPLQGLESVELQAKIQQIQVSDSAAKFSISQQFEAVLGRDPLRDLAYGDNGLSAEQQSAVRQIYQREIGATGGPGNIENATTKLEGAASDTYIQSALDGTVARNTRVADEVQKALEASGPIPAKAQASIDKWTQMLDEGKNLKGNITSVDAINKQFPLAQDLKETIGIARTLGEDIVTPMNPTLQTNSYTLAARIADNAIKDAIAAGNADVTAAWNAAKSLDAAAVQELVNEGYRTPVLALAQAQTLAAAQQALASFARETASADTQWQNAVTALNNATTPADQAAAAAQMQQPLAWFNSTGITPPALLNADEVRQAIANGSPQEIKAVTEDRALNLWESTDQDAQQLFARLSQPGITPALALSIATELNQLYQQSAELGAVGITPDFAPILTKARTRDAAESIIKGLLQPDQQVSVALLMAAPSRTGTPLNPNQIRTLANIVASVAEAAPLSSGTSAPGISSYSTDSVNVPPSTNGGFNAFASLQRMQNGPSLAAQVNANNLARAAAANENTPATTQPSSTVERFVENILAAFGNSAAPASTPSIAIQPLPSGFFKDAVVSGKITMEQAGELARTVYSSNPEFRAVDDVTEAIDSGRQMTSENAEAFANRISKSLGNRYGISFEFVDADPTTGKPVQVVPADTSLTPLHRDAEGRAILEDGDNYGSWSPTQNTVYFYRALFENPSALLLEIRHELAAITIADAVGGKSSIPYVGGPYYATHVLDLYTSTEVPEEVRAAADRIVADADLGQVAPIRDLNSPVNVGLSLYSIESIFNPILWPQLITRLFSPLPSAPSTAPSNQAASQQQIAVSDTSLITQGNPEGLTPQEVLTLVANYAKPLNDEIARTAATTWADQYQSMRETGTFGDGNILQIDANGNVVLYRQSENNDILVKSGLYANPAELIRAMTWEDQINHAVHTSAKSGLLANPNAVAVRAVAGVFRIPVADFIELAKEHKIVIGRPADEIVLSGDAAEQYLAERYVKNPATGTFVPDPTFSTTGYVYNPDTAKILDSYKDPAVTAYREALAQLRSDFNLAEFVRDTAGQNAAQAKITALDEATPQAVRDMAATQEGYEAAPNKSAFRISDGVGVTPAAPQDQAPAASPAATKAPSNTLRPLPTVTSPALVPSFLSDASNVLPDLARGLLETLNPRNWFNGTSGSRFVNLATNFLRVLAVVTQLNGQSSIGPAASAVGNFLDAVTTVSPAYGAPGESNPISSLTAPQSEVPQALRDQVQAARTALSALQPAIDAFARITSKMPSSPIDRTLYIAQAIASPDGLTIAGSITQFPQLAQTLQNIAANTSVPQASRDQLQKLAQSLTGIQNSLVTLKFSADTAQSDAQALSASANQLLSTLNSIAGVASNVAATAPASFESLTAQLQQLITGLKLADAFAKDPTAVLKVLSVPAIVVPNNVLTAPSTKLDALSPTQLYDYAKTVTDRIKATLRQLGISDINVTIVDTNGNGAALSPRVVNQSVVIDLQFFRNYQTNAFANTGSTMVDYAFAHEIGHLVQDAAGITARMNARLAGTEQALSAAEKANIQNAYEQQADRIGAALLVRSRVAIDPTEAYGALVSAGDDAIALRKSQPLRIDAGHGLASDRVRAFESGLDGDLGSALNALASFDIKATNQALLDTIKSGVAAAPSGAISPPVAAPAAARVNAPAPAVTNFPAAVQRSVTPDFGFPLAKILRSTQPTRLDTPAMTELRAQIAATESQISKAQAVANAASSESVAELRSNLASKNGLKSSLQAELDRLVSAAPVIPPDEVQALETAIQKVKAANEEVMKTGKAAGKAQNAESGAIALSAINAFGVAVREAAANKLVPAASRTELTKLANRVVTLSDTMLPLLGDPPSNMTAFFNTDTLNPLRDELTGPKYVTGILATLQQNIGLFDKALTAAQAPNPNQSKIDSLKSQVAALNTETTALEDTIRNIAGTTYTKDEIDAAKKQLETLQADLAKLNAQLAEEQKRAPQQPTEVQNPPAPAPVIAGASEKDMALIANPKLQIDAAKIGSVVRAPQTPDVLRLLDADGNFIADVAKLSQGAASEAQAIAMMQKLNLIIPVSGLILPQRIPDKDALDDPNRMIIVWPSEAVRQLDAQLKQLGYAGLPIVQTRHNAPERPTNDRSDGTGAVNKYSSQIARELVQTSSNTIFAASRQVTGSTDRVFTNPDQYGTIMGSIKGADSDDIKYGSTLSTNQNYVSGILLKTILLSDYTLGQHGIQKTLVATTEPNHGGPTENETDQHINGRDADIGIAPNAFSGDPRWYRNPAALTTYATTRDAQFAAYLNAARMFGFDGTMRGGAYDTSNIHLGMVERGVTPRSDRYWDFGSEKNIFGVPVKYTDYGREIREIFQSGDPSKMTWQKFSEILGTSQVYKPAEKGAAKYIVLEPKKADQGPLRHYSDIFRTFTDAVQEPAAAPASPPAPAVAPPVVTQSQTPAPAAAPTVTPPTFENIGKLYQNLTGDALKQADTKIQGELIQRLQSMGYKVEIRINPAAKFYKVTQPYEKPIAPFKYIVAHHTSGGNFESDAAGMNTTQNRTEIDGSRISAGFGATFTVENCTSGKCRIALSAPLSERTNHVSASPARRISTSGDVYNWNALGVEISARNAQSVTLAAQQTFADIAKAFGEVTGQPDFTQHAYGHTVINNNKESDEGLKAAMLARQTKEDVAYRPQWVDPTAPAVADNTNVTPGNQTPTTAVVAPAPQPLQNDIVQTVRLFDGREATVIVPQGYDRSQGPKGILLFNHGDRERVKDTINSIGQMKTQLKGTQMLIIAPTYGESVSTTVDEPVWAAPGAYSQMLDAASKDLSTMLGGAVTADSIRKLPIVIASFSGGGSPTWRILSRENALSKQVRGVILLDALYSSVEDYANWLKNNPNSFLVSGYTRNGAAKPDTTERLNLALSNKLTEMRISVNTSVISQITPTARVSIIPTVVGTKHNSFTKTAWVEDPIKQVLQSLNLNSTVAPTLPLPTPVTVVTTPAAKPLVAPKALPGLSFVGITNVAASAAPVAPRVTPPAPQTPAPSSPQGTYTEDNVTIAGDSIGRGIAGCASDHGACTGTIFANTTAVLGVPIRKVADQIASLPSGSKVIVAAGTNNIGQSDADIAAEVKAVLDAANAKGVQIIAWVGPSLDVGNATQNRQLGETSRQVQAALKDTSIPFLNVRESPSLRGMSSGYHYTTAGYKEIGSLALKAANAAQPAPTAPPATSALPEFTPENAVVIGDSNAVGFPAGNNYWSKAGFKTFSMGGMNPQQVYDTYVKKALPFVKGKIVLLFTGQPNELPGSNLTMQYAPKMVDDLIAAGAAKVLIVGEPDGSGRPSKYDAQLRALAAQKGAIFVEVDQSNAITRGVHFKDYAALRESTATAYNAVRAASPIPQTAVVVPGAQPNDVTTAPAGSKVAVSALWGPVKTDKAGNSFTDVHPSNDALVQLRQTIKSILTAGGPVSTVHILGDSIGRCIPVMCDWQHGEPYKYLGQLKASDFGATNVTIKAYGGATISAVIDQIPGVATTPTDRTIVFVGTNVDKDTAYTPARAQADAQKIISAGVKNGAQTISVIVGPAWSAARTEALWMKNMKLLSDTLRDHALRSGIAYISLGDDSVGLASAQRSSGYTVYLPGTLPNLPAVSPAALPDTASQPLTARADGTIDPVAFYNRMVYKVLNSPLNGTMPTQKPVPLKAKEAARDWRGKVIPLAMFGVTRGTPQEWARLFDMIQRQESSHKVAPMNADGTVQRFPTTPAGEKSYGPGQFNIGEYGLKTWADVNNPDKVIDAYIKVVLEGSMYTYFGSLQAPNETLQHAGWFNTDVAPYVNQSGTAVAAVQVTQPVTAPATLPLPSTEPQVPAGTKEQPNIVIRIGSQELIYRAAPGLSQAAIVELAQKQNILALVINSGKVPSGIDLSKITFETFEGTIDVKDIAKLAPNAPTTANTRSIIPPASGPYTTSGTRNDTAQIAQPVTSDIGPNSKPRLQNDNPWGGNPIIIESMKEASKYLPAGFTVRITSAARECRDGVCQSAVGKNSGHIQRDPTGQYALAHDVMIYGPDDKIYNPGNCPQANIRCATNFGVYREFMQNVKTAQDKLYPQYKDVGRWGGYFVKGNAEDLMHYDLLPASTAAGNWQNGLSADYARYGTPDQIGKGMGTNYEMLAQSVTGPSVPYSQVAQSPAPAPTTAVVQQPSPAVTQPATIPSSVTGPALSAEAAEAMAQKIVADVKAANPNATNKDLAAAVFLKGVENTKTFRDLQAAMLAGDTSEKNVRAVNIEIGKAIADLSKSTKTPIVSYTSFTGDPKIAFARNYLYEKYAKRIEKSDGTNDYACGAVKGDFTCKDPAGALNQSYLTGKYVSLADQVIGGLNTDLIISLYAEGRAMDAAGINWGISAAYRSAKYRPPVYRGEGAVAASPDTSEHAFGRAVDVVGATAADSDKVYTWDRQHSKEYGLRANYINNDPSHTTLSGDAQALARNLTTLEADVKATGVNPQPAPTTVPSPSPAPQAAPQPAAADIVVKISYPDGSTQDIAFPPGAVKADYHRTIANRLDADPKFAAIKGDGRFEVSPDFTTITRVKPDGSRAIVAGVRIDVSKSDIAFEKDTTAKDSGITQQSDRFVDSQGREVTLQTLYPIAPAPAPTVAQAAGPTVPTQLPSPLIVSNVQGPAAGQYNITSFNALVEANRYAAKAYGYNEATVLEALYGACSIESGCNSLIANTNKYHGFGQNDISSTKLGASELLKLAQSPNLTPQEQAYVRAKAAAIMASVNQGGDPATDAVLGPWILLGYQRGIFESIKGLTDPYQITAAMMLKQFGSLPGGAYNPNSILGPDHVKNLNSQRGVFAPHGINVSQAMDIVLKRWPENIKLGIETAQLRINTTAPSATPTAIPNTLQTPSVAATSDVAPRNLIESRNNWTEGICKGNNCGGMKYTGIAMDKIRDMLQKNGITMGKRTGSGGEVYATYPTLGAWLASDVIKRQAYITERGLNTLAKMDTIWATPDADHPTVSGAVRMAAFQKAGLTAAEINEQIDVKDVQKLMKISIAVACAEYSQCNASFISELDRQEAVRLLQNAGYEVPGATALPATPGTSPAPQTPGTPNPAPQTPGTPNPAPQPTNPGTQVPQQVPGDAPVTVDKPSSGGPGGPGPGGDGPGGTPPGGNPPGGTGPGASGPGPAGGVLVLGTGALGVTVVLSGNDADSVSKENASGSTPEYQWVVKSTGEKIGPRITGEAADRITATSPNAYIKSVGPDGKPDGVAETTLSTASDGSVKVEVVTDGNGKPIVIDNSVVPFDPTSAPKPTVSADGTTYKIDNNAPATTPPAPGPVPGPPVRTPPPGRTSPDPYRESGPFNPGSMGPNSQPGALPSAPIQPAPAPVQPAQPQPVRPLAVPPTPGNKVPLPPGSCAQGTVCGSSILYSRNTQCVDTQIQACVNGCVNTGSASIMSTACSAATSTSPQGTPVAPSISCTPSSVVRGNITPVTVQWNCASGTLVSSGFTSGTQSGQSFVTLPANAAATTTFSGYCKTAAARGPAASCMVRVVNPSVSLVANPSTVQKGGVAILSWSSSNVSSCVVYAAGIPLKIGNATDIAQTGTLMRSTVFRERCIATAGASTTASVLVHVSGDSLTPLDAPLPR